MALAIGELENRCRWSAPNFKHTLACKAICFKLKFFQITRAQNVAGCNRIHPPQFGETTLLVFPRRTQAPPVPRPSYKPLLEMNKFCPPIGQLTLILATHLVRPAHSSEELISLAFD